MNRILGLFFVSVFLPVAAWAQEYGQPVHEPMADQSAKDWTFTTAATYSSGDYGTNTTTETWYVPFTLQKNFSLGRVYVTVPYIAQRNSNNGVQVVQGRPFRTANPRAANADWVNGVGDVLLGGSYDLLREPAQPFSLSPFAEVKFPSADEDKGLGTGEFDESVGVRVSKDLGQNWSVLGSLGGSFIGDPPGMDLNNQFFFTAGAGYQWTSEIFTSLSYEERTKIVDGQPNARDLVLGINTKMNSAVGLFGNIGAGLTDASPDVFVTAGVNVWF